MDEKLEGDREGLRREVRETRAQTVEVVSETDHLRLQTIPNIRADYALRIGCWEVEMLHAELSCRRAKRRLSLARACANEGRPIEKSALEQQLDEELAAWIQRVGEASRDQYAHLERATNGQRLSVAEERRLKSIYRKLVKRLHPDLHADEESARLFKIAVQAYKTGDLVTLNALEISTRHLDDVDDLAGLDAQQLAVALELAQIELGVIQDKLAKLKEDPVFELERLMSSSEWVSRRVSELKGKIQAFNEARAEYDARYQELVA